MIAENEAHVLIDLRPGDVAEKGHIKGAVSIPLAALAAAESSFPKDKSAPVILYDDEQAPQAAFDMVRNWGYKNTSVLQGGAKLWPGKFLAGPTAREIVYAKTLKPGQIDSAEFKKIAAGDAAGKIILDVRDGAVAGVIPGALTIPEPNLSERLKDLPKDRELIIHCNTGILASMALKTLTANGYQARFLDAVVQVKPDGSYEITEK